MANCRACLVEVDSLNALTISYSTSIVELQGLDPDPNGTTINVCNNCNTSIGEMLTKLNE
tara:strand:- start:663 stop:842 length:180 start_codon:yes stop_codon:yes gene_type:complete